MPKRLIEPTTTGLVGYARVSTLDQSLELQEVALRKFGCIKIFTDQASGKTADRPGLEDVMKFLRDGDTLVVWKLDRLGRSVQDLIRILDDLKERGVKFHSLQEQINTTNAAGRMFFQMVAIFAEFERNLNSERTHAGLAVARASGRVGGRKRKLNSAKLIRARALLSTDPPTPIKDVCRLLDCSVRTLRRELKAKPETSAEDTQGERRWSAAAASPIGSMEQVASLATSHPPSGGAHRHA